MNVLFSISGTRHSISVILLKMSILHYYMNALLVVFESRNLILIFVSVNFDIGYFALLYEGFVCDFGIAPPNFGDFGGGVFWLYYIMVCVVILESHNPIFLLENARSNFARGGGAQPLTRDSILIWEPVIKLTNFDFDLFEVVCPSTTGKLFRY